MILSILFVLAAHAEPRLYKISANYEARGQNANTSVVVKENTDAIIAQTISTGNGSYFKVVPRPQNNREDNQVMLEMELGTIQNGKYIPYAHPQIMALENEPAEMEMGSRDKSGKPILEDYYKIKVTVTRAN